MSDDESDASSVVEEEEEEEEITDLSNRCAHENDKFACQINSLACANLEKEIMNEQGYSRFLINREMRVHT